MNNIGKYCLGGFALAIVGFLCWYFSSIIAYILIAVIISFLGRPVMNCLERLEIKGYHIPEGLRAAIALICIWVVFILFFYTVIPLVSQEFQSLSDISITNIVNKLEDPLADLEQGLKRFGILESDQDVKEYIVTNLKSVVDVTQIQNMLDSIQRLLMRYFIGITFEVLIVMGLNILGLTIVGLPFNNAVLIGLITGITNVIPYIGPLIGAAFGLSVGIATNVDVDFYTVVFPLLIYMSIVFIITQLIDNVVLQPLIYGNSVHAHPMEIFLVILIAGNLAGIPGMILAIPGYTVLRVILREFFNKYKLVKSLTKGLEDEK